MEVNDLRNLQNIYLYNNIHKKPMFQTDFPSIIA